jgi:pantoate--beta-alanine ligase
VHRAVALAMSQVTVIRTIPELQQASRAHRLGGRRVALVPTMGALHAGHGRLLQNARAHGDWVVCSIFVNQMQFGAGEDFNKYPRTFDADLDVCRQAGCQAVFAPSAEDMYPRGFATTITPGPLGAILEGAYRPGHFDGVMTVVCKLLQAALPDAALFGEKDYQQLCVLRQLVQDLNMPIEVVPMAIVREADGLAMSSRNRYLSIADRQRALIVVAAVRAGQRAFAAGERDPRRIEAAARAVLASDAAAEPDYIEVRDAATLGEVSTLSQAARLLMTVRVGGVRLLDNGALDGTVIP